ncbi:DNA-3-methyladenine glycosylase family protein [Peribacillus sp. SCS-37]|uniref:DNA-3-methyladenine glycosylase family protein n=1 Tax=Paraperibacillus esterisolvens TaxID=3115296 RepID=UPI0039057B8C
MNGIYLKMERPPHFNFSEILAFLNRSSEEVLHRVEGRTLFKRIKVEDERILIKVTCEEGQILLEFPAGASENGQKAASVYIREWLDLDRDLTGFFWTAARDPVIEDLAVRFKGLRLIGIPDLFEALSWAVIGQQINLSYAYKIKKRFVERYGERADYGGETYWLFPDCRQIAVLSTEELTQFSFTKRKAEYIIGIAGLMAGSKLTKESLRQAGGFKEKKALLMNIRGVGDWTAEYVLMKCLREPSALPAGDAGFQNALIEQLGLSHKPSTDEINSAAARWRGWEAYAVFYLWRSLYD